jgi:hypothetical protein
MSCWGGREATTVLYLVELYDYLAYIVALPIEEPMQAIFYLELSRKLGGKYLELPSGDFGVLMMSDGHKWSNLSLVVDNAF